MVAWSVNRAKANHWAVWDLWEKSGPRVFQNHQGLSRFVQLNENYLATVYRVVLDYSRKNKMTLTVSIWGGTICWRERQIPNDYNPKKTSNCCQKSSSILARAVVLITVIVPISWPWLWHCAWVCNWPEGWRGIFACHGKHGALESERLLSESWLVSCSKLLGKLLFSASLSLSGKWVR